MGRDEKRGQDCRRTEVSIHAPAWGATFSSAELGEIERVSIHAPAWGATKIVAYLSDPDNVSIHAPAWGATFGHVTRHRDSDSFNPRARMGRDQGYRETAPALLMFQSTRPHGARLYEGDARYLAATFQSTRPHGARHSHSFPANITNEFQSTRPHGARLFGQCH